MPVDPMLDFELPAQQAFFVYNVLPDKIDSMGGIWLGKDFSGIGDILDIYAHSNKREVLDYLIYMIQTARSAYAKERELQSKLQS